MKKKQLLTSNIIFFVIVLLVMIVLISKAFAVEISNEEALEKYNLVLSDIQAVETDDIDYLKELISDCSNQMSNAHQAAEYMRKMHYLEESLSIRIMQHDWLMYKHLQDNYKIRLNELRTSQIVTDAQMNEYPVAAKVWKMLKEQGYNDYVCAGIIGNMMTECGGNTLNLNYQAYGSSGYYYGLCQWNRGTYSGIFGCNTEEQVKFLLGNIRYELNTYYDYNTFLNCTNEQDAALIFAKYYERCGSGSYYTRQVNATTAYNYFAK